MLQEIFNVDLLKKSNRAELLKIFFKEIKRICKNNNSDKLITNGYIGSALQDLKYYKYNANTITLSSIISKEPYMLGTISNIEIYIDANMRWNDCKIIFEQTLKRKRTSKILKIVDINKSEYISELLILDNQNRLL